MNTENQQFLRDTALSYFLKYVKINSQSNPESTSFPSEDSEIELGKIIVQDLLALGISDAEIDKYGYVYATLHATDSGNNAPLSFIAHLDTSPAESGADVKPTIIENYQGGTISYTDDSLLILNPTDCPQLTKFISEDIITASGKTLLGADNKAGVAEIISACALMQKDATIKHPEIRLVFTPDEEIGKGTDKIDLTRLGKIAYTIDGGEMGELETECFDAWSAKICFTGRNVHPGSAKDIMLNAAAIAARYFADIPEFQTPEHTDGREGFYHLTDISGDENYATLQFILRDFVLSNNENRMEYLNKLKELYLYKYPGLLIELTVSHSYQNMHHILVNHPDVIKKAAKTIEDCGVKVIRNAVRGGTDGARLCYMGIPTPNIFTGGMMFHSKREWIPVIALQKAAEVIVRLAELYS